MRSSVIACLIVSLAIAACTPASHAVQTSPAEAAPQLVLTTDAMTDPHAKPLIRVVGSSPPPAGRSIIWHRDVNNGTRILASDWDGQPAGWLSFDQPIPYVHQSPDGSRLLIGNEVVSSAGQVVYPVPSGVWADDNRHLCAVRTADGGVPGPYWNPQGPGRKVGVLYPAWLFLVDPAGSARRVAPVGDFGEKTGLGVLACSLKTNRAILAQSFLGEFNRLAVYSLSTGERQYAARPLDGTSPVAASHDGGLVAQSDRACDCTHIVQMPSGRTLGLVNGATALAFSWDGSLLATQGPEPWRASVQNWRIGQTLWTSSAIAPGLVRVRPGAGDFVIESDRWRLTDWPHTNAPPNDVWIVPASGAARILLSQSYLLCC